MILLDPGFRTEGSSREFYGYPRKCPPVSFATLYGSVVGLTFLFFLQVLLRRDTYAIFWCPEFEGTVGHCFLGL
jgi:hypothetical protein